MRLDVVCMSLFRMLWRMLSSSVCVFLYLDSSPQAEGVELFAVSFELWALDGSVPFMRRLMPVILLPRNFWDASGKLVALLWCIWLLVGPRPDDVLRFVMSIRSITTAMGTERMLAIMPDILPDFFSLLLGFHQHGLPHRQFTFDLALQVPGWMHSWDVIIKRCLSSLSWFPSWLDKFKSIVKICRTQSMTKDMSRQLRIEGLPGIAEMISRIYLPSVAERR